MNLKYILGVIISIPLIPFLYFQGKKIKRSVPSLPEAADLEGVAGESNSQKLSILAVGESTIAGVGVKSNHDGFASAFAGELSTHLETQVKWKVYAKSGYNVARVDQEIIPQITETDIDLIVVGIGGNDAFELNTPKQWKKGAVSLINNIRQKFPDTPIVFGNMPPIKEFPAFTPLIRFVIGNLGQIFGEELVKIVDRQENVYFYSRIVELKDWGKRLGVNANPNDYFSDGVHPSSLTYKVWAKDIVNYILQNPDLKNYLQDRVQRSTITI